MEFPREITAVQAAAILISTIIGVGILALPRLAVEAGDTGAPLVTLLGIVVSCLGLWLITFLGMRFPEKSIIRYSEVLLGKWASFIGSMLIIGFFAVLTALAAREFGEVVITSVLPRTPLEVTVIVMLLLAAITSRNDITTFAYVHMFYLPFILAPALMIVAFALKNATITNALPLMGNGPKGMLTGVATVAALFQGSFIHAWVIPAMRRPEKAMKSSIWGMVVAGGLYFIIVLATLAVFGSEEIKLLLWPTLELAKTTSLPGNVLERLDAAFLAVWVTAVFSTLYSSYYLTVHALSELFRFRDHKLFSFFIFPFVFVIAMFPSNILHMYRIIESVGRIGLLITIGYPTLLAILAILRKKKGERHADKKMDQAS